MKVLKKYQEIAVGKLIKRTKDFLLEEGNETLVFQAPTGSGKTFMASRFIDELIKEVNDDLCFLWVSIGKGELHKQSMKSVKKEIGQTVKCLILEDDFLGYNKVINQNEIVFLNWEKIRSKDKTTGDWKNVAMKDSEKTNFIEVLENTRSKNRKIILIIDESHSSSKSQRALEIRDEIVKPDITIEMSATPVLTNDSDSKVTVPASSVIEEGMIKKEVLINQDIDLIDEEIDSQQLIIENAIKKREELAKLYKENNSIVNPLVLIQIPNSNTGDDVKDAVISILRRKNITEESGKVAIWLSDEKVNNSSDLLLPLDGKVEYLIFKQAIDTGWDCPRAQILVRFRDTNSIIFEIQTVGRILRMPEAKHYLNEELNKAYVYTNIKSILVKKEIYNPNIIKTLYSKRKDDYVPEKLLSYYRQRVDYGNITSSFYTTFENEFCRFFGIKKEKLYDYFENMEKLKAKGVICDFSKMDEIIKDGKISSELLDKLNDDITSDKINVNYSENDLEAKFESIINSNLNGFAPKRSMSAVKQAIYYTFKNTLNLNTIRGGSIYIQSLVVKNEKMFSILLDIATKTYKSVHEEEVRQKTEEKLNENWEIPLTKNYNPEVYTEYNLPISLHQPLFVKIGDNGKPNKLEIEFMNYINDNSLKYEWLWKNGDEHMESNFGIKKEDSSTFQPDFIIKFRDGRIGIFDTKEAGDREDDNAMKANALRRYAKEENKKGKKIVAGLVIKDNGHFRVNLSDNYIPFKIDESGWEYFENI